MGRGVTLLRGGKSQQSLMERWARALHLSAPLTFLFTFTFFSPNFYFHFLAGQTESEDSSIGDTVTKGSLQNKFSVKVGILAQPA